MRIASSATYVRLCRAAFALAALSLGASAQAPGAPACRGVDYNRMILDIIGGLPKGGGYTLNSDKLELPIVAPLEIDNRWAMLVRHGHPSHCTSATYAVFAHLAVVLQANRKLYLSGDQIRALEPAKTLPDGTRRLVDGEGPFWIFNANGAGAAALLKHTGTGISFRDDALAYAKPGDFLKIFWNKNVGASEKGHQAIYTGRRIMAGRPMVCFWGSQRQNKKKRDRHVEPLYFPAADGGKVYDGYGEVCRPRSDIEGMIFSRVTCMEHLGAGLDDMRAKAQARGSAPGGLPYLFVDDFLASLRETSSDAETLDRTYDILPAPSAIATVGSAPTR